VDAAGKALPMLRMAVVEMVPNRQPCMSLDRSLYRRDHALLAQRIG
jgi:hypothetical protein